MNVDKLFLKSVKNGKSLRLHPWDSLLYWEYERNILYFMKTLTIAKHI